ncbi:uncharacterized protein LOC127078553 [Lathyrus oleraceus]|uniref:uncharacterized protein LOC127078553 n=1 Tax=Pisum sativum TaxID=3888 RepID=UPI0021CE39F2|nr:uncharacterized protein LOC127078553 [Pisum sativum]
MEALQSRYKSYHDKMREALKFQEGDHVFLRGTPVTGVGRTLKSKKLTMRFIGLFQILQRLNGVQFRENLMVETLSLRIEDRQVKSLRDMEITSMEVVWGGPVSGSVTWELESRMREFYLELFSSGNIRGRKFF